MNFVLIIKFFFFYFTFVFFTNLRDIYFAMTFECFRIHNVMRHV